MTEITPLALLILLPLALISYVLVKPYWVKARRNKIASQPFPKAWRKILKSHIPYFYKMPADLQLQLKQRILVFLEEKSFQGFDGLEITDEIRVTIAAQACLLLLNRESGYYPKLKTIYVYPAAFRTDHQSVDGAGVLQRSKRVLSGESWDYGKVVLSWKDTRIGAADFADGQNLVIHEFAHQLDQETGSANGAPYLRFNNLQHWTATLSTEFEALRRRAARGEETLLDYYGATNPAEFFAVVSEVFFERPKELLQQHKALYEQLQLFYRVNPAIW
ncbi:M90 family metallopeptidase [Aliikangiella sp. IMCC44653]